MAELLGPAAHCIGCQRWTPLPEGKVVERGQLRVWLCRDCLDDERSGPVVYTAKASQVRKCWDLGHDWGEDPWCRRCGRPRTALAPG